MKTDTIRPLPYSAERYYVTQYGEVLNRSDEIIKTRQSEVGATVELEWLFGKKHYRLDLLVVLTFKLMLLPERLWLQVEPIHLDTDLNNNLPSNLIYCFKQPLEVREFPGYYYIPFFTGYAISKEGELINAVTGQIKSWYITKPNQKRNAVGGYYFTSVNQGGNQTNLGRHRAMALTFLDYDHTVTSKTVNHENGVPGNDLIDNLSWVSYSRNNEHAYASGLRPNASKPILMKELQTGKVTRFETVVSCARSLGYKTGSFIYYRLNKSNSKGFPDQLAFKYDDGSEWPDITQEQVSHWGTDQAVAARNVFTNEVTIFRGFESGEQLTGVSKSNISAHVQRGYVIPIQGYNFRYFIADLIWPEFTKWHLEVFRHYPKNPGNGFFTTDLTTGEETFYPGRREVLQQFDLSASYLATLATTEESYKNQFRFRYFKLKDNIGPSIE